jgi:predicted nucleic acid-binding protein
MRFLDANVFVYAYYRPRRELSVAEREIKAKAKAILRGIDEGGESVLTTVVHLSIVSNILKHGMAPGDLAEFVQGLLMADNIVVEGVGRDLNLSATDLGRELDLDPNDALAVEVMRLNGVEEIYTFDHDFDGVQGIVRLPASG